MSVGLQIIEQAPTTLITWRQSIATFPPGAKKLSGSLNVRNGELLNAGEQCVRPGHAESFAERLGGVTHSAEGSVDPSDHDAGSE